MSSNFEFISSLKQMKSRKYWNKANTVEFVSFMIKVAIIVPGLLFGVQVWWFYIFALLSSLSLIWSSTVKTLPGIIIFNMIWVMLAITAIIKYWV